MAERDRPGERTVLITGATGALGPAVIRRFVEAGWHVRTLSRRPAPADSPAARYPHFTADVQDQAALREALRGVDAVVHMAALLHVVDPPAALAAEYRRVNVDGTAAVVSAACESGVERVVFLSSISVYGPRPDVVDETTPPSPDTAYAETKLEAEQLVLSASSAAGKPLGVVLRLAAVYGPSVKRNYARLVRALHRRRFVLLGSGENRRTLVFDEDAAQAMLLAARHPAAPGRIFNATDGAFHSVDSIINAICNALGREPPWLRVPARPVRVLVEAAYAMAPGVRAIRRLRTGILKYTEDVVVDGSRIQNDLGFSPRVEFFDGWRRTVSGLKQDGSV